MKLLYAAALTIPMLACGAGAALAQASSGDGSSGGSLSDKLGDTGGVIRPKENIDPHMDKAAPRTPGNTPVIKPPGTAGKPGPTPK